jgi:hypothetical protein
MQKEGQNHSPVAPSTKGSGQFCSYTYIGAFLSAASLFIVSLANPYNNSLFGYAFAAAMGLWFTAFASGLLEWRYSKTRSLIMVAALLLFTVVGVLLFIHVAGSLD